MARLTVGNPYENQLPSISGTAQAVDTYVRSTANTQQFDQLAQTIQALSGKARQALSAEEDRAAKTEFAEGQELYNRTRLSMGDAVREGAVPEGASPFVRKGYRASLMGTLSSRYANELDNALTSRKLYTSGDPKRIETFIADFQSQYMEKNGLSEFSPSEVAEYFGNDANRANEQFRGAWQKQHIAWQTDQAYLAIEGQVASVTAGLFHQGMTEEEQGAAKVQLTGWLEGQAAGHSANGLDNKRVTDMVIQGVGIASGMTGDPEILDVFLGTKFGTAAVASSLDNQVKLLTIRNNIIAAQAAEARRVNAEYDDSMSNLRGEVSANIFTMTADPANIDVDAINVETARLVATGDEKNVGEATKWRNVVNSLEADLEGINQTPDTMLLLDQQLSKATTREEARDVISGFIEQGSLKTTDISSALSSWETNYNKDVTGLDFNTTRSNEGSALNFFLSIVGDADDYKPITASNRAIARVDYIRTYSAEYEATKTKLGRAPTRLEELDIGEKVRVGLIQQYTATGKMTFDTGLQPVTGERVSVPNL